MVDKRRSSLIDYALSCFSPEEDEGQPKIPLVPKRRRDPNAVLKALSSTVSPLQYPSLMGGRSLADPLVPKNRTQHVDYVRSLEAGRKAAKYVIHRWPRMFPDIRLDPDLRPKKVKVKGCNENTLNHLIARRKMSKALKMYKKLHEKGRSVSLETQNGLLALLAHFGMGNPRKKGHPLKQQQDTSDTLSHVSEDLEAQQGRVGGVEERDLLELKEMGEEIKSSTDSGRDVKVKAQAKIRRLASGEAMSSQPTVVFPQRASQKPFESGNDSSSNEEKRDTGTVASPTTWEQSPSSTFGVRTVPPPNVEETGRVWSLDNHAEKFFSEMTEKDGGTYDALIQGVAKFEGYNRAFELFEEMREKHYQASLATYNSLLTAIVKNQRAPYSWKKAKDIVGHMMKEPIVKPNITTMNLILNISYRTGTASREFALQTMRELAYLGLEPNLTTFLRLLQAYLRHGDASILYDIVEYLEKNEHVITLNEKFDLYFFSASMSAARLLRDSSLGMRLKKLAMKDNWFLVETLTFFLNHYLITVAFCGDLETLKQEYQSLVPNTFTPFEWTYGSLFRACEDKGPEFALEMWKDMMKHRVGISKPETIERFCGALSRRIDPHDAERYLQGLNQAWKKLDYLSMKPPAFLISQTMRFHIMMDELDKAWEYFSYFDKYSMPPSFLALNSLLRGHYGHRDTDSEKIVEIMELMISNGMVLPMIYVRDICVSIGLASEKKNQLLAGFSKNERASQLSASSARGSSTRAKQHLEGQPIYWKTVQQET